MENYLVDYETLAGFVDEFIAKKYPEDSPEDHQELRKESIEKLGSAIDAAVFDRLSDEQVDELDAILEKEDASENAFDDYLASKGIDLQETITQVIKNFQDEFLGGENE